MSRTLSHLAVIVAVTGLASGTVAANGSSVGGGASSVSSGAQPTPEDVARDTYNNGIDHRDKAKKLEAQAATQPAKDRDSTMKKAQDEYTKALKDFQKAVQLVPGFYQAYNGMGYAYRKTGDYAKALENYDQALKLAPGFPDAMEYRGEAYLGLNRVEDAKQSYLALFATDRKQADQLLSAMSEWVAKHQTNASGVDPSVVSAVDGWVKERAKIASTTVAMSLAGTRSIWK
jgi:tetratricopeptide (TPR) repeat protein